jgi:hypothetical protein
MAAGSQPPEDLPPTRHPHDADAQEWRTERLELGSCNTKSNSSTARPTPFANGAPTHEASRAPSRLLPTLIGRLAPSRCVSSMRMGARFIPRIGARLSVSVRVAPYPAGFLSPFSQFTKYSLRRHNGQPLLCSLYHTSTRLMPQFCGGHTIGYP